MKNVGRWLLLVPVLVVYIAGLFTDVMEADAAQYASMSYEMSNTGNYLQIYHRGADYIDKPPLIFWTAALSFKIFGASNFAYKLPSLLFALLGLFATYRLARMYYRENVAWVSVLILSSCHAWFMINQDVRTDTILASCVILSIWQIAEFIQSKRTINAVYAAIAVSGAMLTKGPIGLMVPGLAFAMDIALKRQWNVLFRWQWLLMILIIGICLLPMCIGLYQQFDAVGGKETYNGLITSGLRFYFWTQSFGRLTGESTWKDDTDAFYFVHTFLWAFLPWCLVFYAGFVKKIIGVFKSRFRIGLDSEVLTFGGILFPAIAMSISQYKLPHYIFVFFPLCAIVAACFMVDVAEKAKRSGYLTLFWIQAFVAFLLIALSVFVCVVWIVDVPFIVYVLITVAAVSAVYVAIKGETSLYKVLLPSFFGIVTLNMVFNFALNPMILKYESGNAAGRYASTTDYPLVGLRHLSYAIDFYLRRPASVVSIATDLQKYYGQNIWVYTDDGGVSELKRSSFIKVIDQRLFPHYHVSKLRTKFLNPETRESTLTNMYLVLVEVKF